VTNLDRRIGEKAPGGDYFSDEAKQRVGVGCAAIELQLRGVGQGRGGDDPSTSAVELGMGAMVSRGGHIRRHDAKSVRQRAVGKHGRQAGRRD